MGILVERLKADKQEALNNLAVLGPIGKEEYKLVEEAYGMALLRAAIYEDAVDKTLEMIGRELPETFRASFWRNIGTKV